MGLFDQGNKKKKKDDFGSPVEKIDLASAPVASADDDDGDDEPEPARPAAAPAAPARRPAPALSYGIDDAIALMRTLPAENVELVVRVVKHTLESTKIEIPAIIDDASAKQERIEARIKVLRSEIDDLEQQIAVRKKEIGELEADHRETTEVKERLTLAEKLGKAAPRPAAGAAPAGNGATGKPGEGRSRPSPSTAPPPTPDQSRATTIVHKK